MKEKDKIKIRVRKEIFKDHLARVDEDELVFIDSNSFDTFITLKVPQ